jgi:hypothetical protein
MFAALKSGAGTTLAITGIVSEKDDDPRTVHVALPPHADRWLAIPEDHIGSFEPVSKIIIDDAEHQIVRLSLKRPSTPEGAIFHDLLAAHVASANAIVQHAAAEGSGAAAATGYCYYDTKGNWICR